MSRHTLIYLIISMCLFLGVRTLDAQEQPNMVICENTRVGLGQTKQQVRNALAVCCRFNSANFFDIEYPNQIVFEANRAGGACSGMLLFDTSEKLVFAQREMGQFDESSSPLGLARALTEAINNLLPNPPAKLDVRDDKTIKIGVANVELHVTAERLGSVNTLFITFGERRLRLVVADKTRLDRSDKRLEVASVEEEIGDMGNGDMKSVPIRK